jgi:hypothetical protein
LLLLLLLLLLLSLLLLFFHRVPKSFSGGKGPRRNLNAHPHLVRKLRMSGTMLLLLLYTLMAWRGRILFFFIIIHHGRLRTPSRHVSVST